MTVSSKAVGRPERYVCQWFVDNRMEHGVFPVEELELVSAEFTGHASQTRP